MASSCYAKIKPVRGILIRNIIVKKLCAGYFLLIMTVLVKLLHTPDLRHFCCPDEPNYVSQKALVFALATLVLV